MAAPHSTIFGSHGINTEGAAIGATGALGALSASACGPGVTADSAEDGASPQHAANRELINVSGKTSRNIEPKLMVGYIRGHEKPCYSQN